MIRSLRLCFARPLIASRLTPPTRAFSAAPILLKKKPKKAVAPQEEDVEEPSALIDFEDATAKFKQVLEKFTKTANESKLGKTNPRIFDKLTVNVNDEEVPFTSVAQTSIKGRNFIVTLFDPASSKHVINTILGSGLNMNAQVDPANKYTLKVPLPPVNTETKKESVKQLKEVFEKMKNGSSKGSLASIRADVKNKFSKQVKKQKSDAETKVLNDFEKLHKTYTEKLAEAFKAAETAILK
ncbi:ribosome recycling factor [Suhomyces tanzawaensis NRRL Y-17324]|uniref:Ribosome-recycling factor, mitochondrial n=1 Tax=Suhomyces tanzawaensis NRRL Y-17324 TaxID=984487 RepID=A0A1E4SKC1_9ASCO|nr:ribosome recycling factor [Suhomyces tanzawaensis NRRL Y-17324]ODV79951.1 ribosome recycling factor [Suhomyces tanzawaensis NRRL Y-17324]